MEGGSGGGGFPSAAPHRAGGGVGGTSGAGGAGGAGGQKRKKGGGGTFDAMGLLPDVLRGVKRKGYRLPTPIQRKAIPPVLMGRDVVAMARTGSGKTAAFVVPMLQRLRERDSSASTRALILSPTRELALQTHKVCKELGRYLSLHYTLVVGGDALEAQFAAIEASPDVIVATPGRLLHHLSEMEGFSLRSVEYCVLDEADRCFEMGFREQISVIMGGLSPARQTLLFSATMPKLLAEFASAGLREPALIRLDKDNKLSPDLHLEFVLVREADKPAALLHMLQSVVPSDQQTLVFLPTKHTCEYLAELLLFHGVEPSVVYGAMDQTARKIQVARFRAKRTSILLTTDVAARGIDIPLLDNVVNYDTPGTAKLFVHRAGRAARAGRAGTAYTFGCPDEVPYVVDLHLFLGRKLVAAGSGAVGAAEPSTDERSVLGRVPQAVLDAANEQVRAASAQSNTVAALVQPAARALKLYLKTRPSASAESARRAKPLKDAGLQPMFLQSAAAVDAGAGAGTIGGGAEGARAYYEQMASAEAEAERMRAAMRNFRPNQTVLETRHLGANSKAREAAAEVMARKRESDQLAIRKTAEQNARARKNARESADYRDEIIGGGGEGGCTSSDDDGGSEDQGNGGADSDAEHGAGLGDGSDASDESGSDVEADGDDDDDSDDGARRPSKRSRRATAKPGSIRSGGRVAGASGPVASGAYRDAAFYVPSLPQREYYEEAGYANGEERGGGESLGTSRIADAVLDLTADDAIGMKAQKTNYHWDRKNKKYVKVHAGEKLSFKGGQIKVTNEAGRKTKSGVAKKSIYQQWKARNKGAGAAHGGAGASGKKGGRAPNADARDELRTPQQVQKARDKKKRMGERARGGGGGRGGGGRGGGRGGGGRGGGRSGGGRGRR